MAVGGQMAAVVAGFVVADLMWRFDAAAVAVVVGLDLYYCYCCCC